jgi:hypothetical protein
MSEFDRSALQSNDRDEVVMEKGGGKMLRWRQCSRQLLPETYCLFGTISLPSMASDLGRWIDIS